MTDKRKEEEMHDDPATQKPGEGNKHQLSEQDLDKVSGGLNPQPLPPSNEK